MAKQGLTDIDPRGKRVLARVDFNVPQDDTGRITDDRRIQASLPTIRYLLDHDAKVILVSHLGRPKGVDPKWSLKPVAERLSELLGKPVPLAPDSVGPAVGAAVSGLRPGDVLLLENVRFHPEEEKNDPAFARQLAANADLFVNDAFGTAHRAHASTEGVTHFLPAVAGFLLQKELEVLGAALDNPRRPFAAILGGKKVSDKIGVIEHLLEKVDALLIGGGMAFTFLKAKGYEIGRSVLDEDGLDLARRVMERAQRPGPRLELPVDVVVAREFDANAESRVVPSDGIPAGWIGMDVGPQTLARFRDALSGAMTIIWNGPMGVFEMPRFAAGTLAVAEMLAERTAAGATTIIGGGDSAAAVEQMGLADRMSHISTGGGASLEFLEGKELPGVAALRDRGDASRQAPDAR
jgi:phosphoglycerate kinase